MHIKNKFSCEAHLDMAFDDFLVENETFPHLSECREKSCDYCGLEAKYKLEAPLEDVSG